MTDRTDAVGVALGSLQILACGLFYARLLWRDRTAQLDTVPSWWLRGIAPARHRSRER